MQQPPRLYHELADWWPLLSAPDEYEEEAAFFYKKFIDASSTLPCTVLELGSGGGNNASHLKKHLEMTLVDISPGMIEVSRALNPECEHYVGDMRTFRLNRQFDVVFIHDAISFMATPEDLRQAMETAFIHCKPGGIALFAPDNTKENFKPSTGHGGHDGPERSMRYVEWSWDPDPTDQTCVTHYTYMLRDQNGEVQVEHEHQIEGLFSRSLWLELMQNTGFKASSTPLIHSEIEPGSHEVFIGVKAG